MWLKKAILGVFVFYRRGAKYAKGDWVYVLVFRLHHDLIDANDSLQNSRR
jgi:hypothetical protein